MKEGRSWRDRGSGSQHSLDDKTHSVDLCRGNAGAEAFFSENLIY